MADAAPERTIIAEARVQEAAQRAVATAFEELTFMETEAVAVLPGLETGQVYAHIQTDAPLPASFTLQMSTGLVDACIDESETETFSGSNRSIKSKSSGWIAPYSPVLRDARENSS